MNTKLIADILEDWLAQFPELHLQDPESYPEEQREAISALLDRLCHSGIGVFWHVNDVQEIRPDLTHGQCMGILEEVKKNHNAEIGINWEVLQGTADELFPDNEEEIRND